MDYLVGAAASDMLPLYIKKGTGSTLSISVDGSSYTDLNYIVLPSGGTTGQVLGWTATGPAWVVVEGGTGGGSTSDYTKLSNKPTINGVILTGNRTGANLGLVDKPSGQVANRYLGTNSSNQLAWLTIDTSTFGLLGGTQTWTGENTFSQAVVSDIGFFAGTGTIITTEGIHANRLSAGDDSWIGGTASTINGTLSVGSLNANSIDVSAIRGTDYLFYNIVGGTTNNIIDIVNGENTVFTVNRTGDVTTIGNVLSAGDAVSTVTATGGTVSIPAQSGHIYLYTAVAGDTITFATPSAGDAPEFEIDITQPSPEAVSFRWGQTITWRFGVPGLATAGALYQLKFRYVNGTWEGWTTPDMSEYATLAGNNVFTGGTNTFTGTSVVTLVTAKGSNAGFSFVDSNGREALGFANYVGNPQLTVGRSGGQMNVTFGTVRFNVAESNLYLNYNASNTAGGFCISDATTGNITSPGALISKGQYITAITASTISAIPAVEGVVYTYTLTGSETITFGTPTSGYMPTFELHLTQPSTAVSFSWGSTIWWDDGTGSFASSNTPPDIDTADTIYCLVFRYANGHYLGNLAYTEEVDSSSSSGA